jgi:hypothetical protein
MASGTGFISDKVKVWHTKRDPETGKILGTTEVTAEVPKEKMFCMECGEPLTPIMIYYCENGCKQRYLVDFDEETGRPVMTVLGREEEEEVKDRKTKLPPPTREKGDEAETKKKKLSPPTE